MNANFFLISVLYDHNYRQVNVNQVNVSKVAKGTKIIDGLYLVKFNT